MKLEDVAIESAIGAILAHSHRVGPGAMLKKGHVVTEADVRALAAAGIARVLAGRLEAGDVSEDRAAHEIALAIAGDELDVAPATTGRANIYARKRGLLAIERERIDALNAIDEAVTVATLAPFSVVEERQMVATVKIIPFAVPEAIVDRACTVARSGAHADRDGVISLRPFAKKRVGLVLTTLAGAPDMSGSQIARAAENQRLRVTYLGGEIAREDRVAHDVDAVARAIEAMLRDGLDIVLVLGASAIVDRGDVVPRAIEKIGGVVDHLGMPVDPGNLLLLAHKGATPIIGVPGCARSLNPSGFDWVLERLCADVAVTAGDVTKMGVGGLLEEIANRPHPRHAGKQAHFARVAAVVLAAGLSRRMEGENKLLAEIAGTKVVARVVDTLLASKASRVFVVVGHEGDRVRAALDGRDVTFVENPNYEEGLGASLRVGIEALPRDLDGALVALGDMPWIKRDHVDALVAAFDPEGANTICIPVHDRKRGHPVLWSARHFAEMKKLSGDIGARGLLEKYAGSVLAVPVADAAIHLDIDTPEMLANARRSD